MESKNDRQIFLILIVAALVFTIIPTAKFAAAVAKDLNGHWARSSIELCRTNGIINGDGDGYYHPDRSATRASLPQW